MEFAGYEICETLYQGPKSCVYRARRAKDGRQVILKTPGGEYVSRRQIAEIRHEQTIAARLTTDGVVRPLSLEESGTRVALVLEDFGGISLRQYLEQRGRLATREFLDIAIQLSATLGEVHRHGVIHKDIKPHNLLIHPETRVVKITDFSSASLLAHETAVPTSPRELEGTIAYMAPEQTGRMNRGIDHRTDLYSLGVTFYELLAGHRPFQLRDPMELIHAHIALAPPLLHDLDLGVPRALSAIVAKLMAKNAEDRYQSARGVTADLEACRRELEGRGALSDAFTPGLSDRPETLQLPQKLYGRELESRALFSAFERVSQGAAELLLISGYSGVGKSALVNEVHKGLAEKRGFFIAGKFDQMSRNVPYAPVAHAFQELMGQILAEPAEVLARWKDTLLGALGQNGQVLIDLIPELGAVIGPQPSVREVGPTEAQNRLALVFQNFIRVFTTAEHPLVVFLDDLQWADPASLKLLHLLLTDPESGHLLVIGAYRDNEVTAAHPLALAIEALRKTGATVGEITLKPLDLANVTQLAADALRERAEQVEPLAKLVFDKTRGNPFFMSQFLTMLYRDGLLFFDPHAAAFRWDERAIREAKVTDNVVEFMAGKIRRLSPEAQRILELAACIGYTFDLKTLSIIRERPEAEAAAELWEALHEELVLPLDAEYRFVHDRAQGGEAQEGDALASFDVSYRFLHDRVQQAAYSLIADEQKKEVHLRIGRLMWAERDTFPRDEDLFDVANHLNFGASLITDPGERLRLARLDLAAGRRAKAATAYQAAADTLRAGLALVPESGWDTDYELTFGLHIELAECEHLSGHSDRAERLFDVLASRARSRQERAQLESLRMILCLTVGKFADGVNAGLRGLSLFGVDVPDGEEARKAALAAELAELDAKLRGRRIEELIDLPELRDPDKQAIQRLMTDVTPAAYFVNPTLFGLVGAKQVNMCMDFGHSEVSAFAYVAYGMFLTGVLGRYREAYEFGKLALALHERFPNPALTSKLHVLFGAFMNFFGEPLRTGHAHFTRAYQAGLAVGDFIYVSYACDQILFIRMSSGDELSSVEEEIDKYLELMQRTKHTLSVELQTIMKQMIANLEGRTKSRLSLSTDTWEEDGYFARIDAAGLKLAASWYCVVKLQLHYLHEDYAGALAMAELGAQRMGSGGVYFATELPFYLALILAALIPMASPADRARYGASLEEQSATLATLAEQCPVNFRQKHLLVAAERARLGGKELEALELYDAAIEAAHNNEFWNHEALANELCARFLLGKGRNKLAYAYLNEAYQGYMRWGATAKARDIAERHPSLSSYRRKADSAPMHHALAVTLSGPSSTGNPLLDLSSVLKAHHAFANEMELSRLLEKVLHIVVQNAGAERGVVLLEQDRRLAVVAEHSARAGGGTSVRTVALEESDAVPATVIQFSHRSSRPVVLENAAERGMFTADPYVLRNRPRSVLCTPILYQGQWIGVLYLENNQTIGAFTPDRLEVLQLLSTEIAISIENARLYTGLKELNQAYRRFVPHEMLALLGKDSVVHLRLGDNVQREMSILFADIRSFTSISEAMTPRETFAFVNTYLEAMGPIIRQCHGYIDKYIGDAILALFPERADDALAAAVAMKRRLAELNESLKREGRTPIGVRTGVHIGSLILGTVGEHERMEGTVISDAVNLTSRLESLCERYGVSLIVSDHLLKRLEDRDRFEHRFLGGVRVRGKAQPVHVFEVFSGEDPELVRRKQATRGDFERGVQALAEADHALAIAQFERVLREVPEDAAARYLLQQATEPSPAERRV